MPFANPHPTLTTALLRRLAGVSGLSGLSGFSGFSGQGAVSHRSPVTQMPGAPPGPTVG